MPTNADQILTTHSGSVPRTLRLQQILLDRVAGKEVDGATFDDSCQEAVSEAVNGQTSAGVTVINDGDQSKTGFAAYITQRLTGFAGPPEERVLNLEQREFPEWAGNRRGRRQPCTGPIEWKDFSMVTADIAHLQKAVASLGQKPAGVFMTSVSPGTFTNHNPNRSDHGRRCHEARIRRHRPGRLHRAARLSRPRRAQQQLP
jgi:5-methyltetrahydropteroyltriglutamate--homocysteine methyltransferase